MQIFKPQVHLKKVNATGVLHIHVITWMDQTKYKADGHLTLPTTPTEGVYTVTLKIASDPGVPNMTLLTPVVHTLTLTGITLDSLGPILEVQAVHTSTSSVIGKKKVHKDDADDSAMPIPVISN